MAVQLMFAQAIQLMLPLFAQVMAVPLVLLLFVQLMFAQAVQLLLLLFAQHSLRERSSLVPIDHQVVEHWVGQLSFWALVEQLVVHQDPFDTLIH